MFAAAESDSSGAESISPQDLQDFVEDAAAYAEENGKEAALEEFNNKEGEFVDGQLYIFANPANDNNEDLKLVYVKKIDDDWYIGSGIYLPGKA